MVQCDGKRYDGMFFFGVVFYSINAFDLCGGFYLHEHVRASGRHSCQY